MSLEARHLPSLYITRAFSPILLGSLIDLFGSHRTQTNAEADKLLLNLSFCSKVLSRIGPKRCRDVSGNERSASEGYATIYLWD
jgi:hypothetical protein